MSRVEKNAPVQDELRAMRGEMLETVKVNGRGVGKKTGCAIILLLMLLAFGLWILVLAARTGLVMIPVISPMVFSTPIPDHRVSAGILMEESVSTQLSRNVSDPNIRLSLSEESLTASARRVLAGSNVNFIDAAKTQVAVGTEDVEIFIPVEGKDTAVTVRLLPKVEDGTLTLSIRSVDIGALALPGVIVDAMLRPAFDTSVGEFNRELEKYVRLDQIRLESGALILSGTRPASQ